MMRKRKVLLMPRSWPTLEEARGVLDMLDPGTDGPVEMEDPCVVAYHPTEPMSAEHQSRSYVPDTCTATTQKGTLCTNDAVADGMCKRHLREAYRRRREAERWVVAR